MKKRSKRYIKNNEIFSKKDIYNIEEAIDILINAKNTKFDETVDIAFNLDIDTKKTDQQIRGTIILPNGTGKKMRIAAFVRGENIKIAEKKGAVAGEEDLINKIMQGWMDFDVAIATPDMMPLVGKIGKILGPRGLMPSPKSQTITTDIEKAIDDINSGKIDYKNDKNGNIHSIIGKLSFGKEKLVENYKVLEDSIIKSRPSSIKSSFIKNICISSTMSPGLKIKIN